MGRVIPFDPAKRGRQTPPEPEESESDMLWTCVECESETLHCYTDGRIECSACGEFIHDLRTFEP